jgi:type VI secretion system secreted protein Hcp
VNKLTIAGLSLLATVAATMPADAAGTTVGANDSVTVTITGRSQGAFPGDATKLNAIRVYHLDFGEVGARDSATGLPTGKRTSTPLRFVKAMDKATPYMFQALATNEVLSTVKFTIAGTRLADNSFGGASDAPLLTITLSNVSVASDTLIAPSDKDPASGVAYGGAVEQVTLTYQKVEIAYAGGKTTTETWQNGLVQ